jgi:hypothetical protein
MVCDLLNPITRGTAMDIKLTKTTGPKNLKQKRDSPTGISLQEIL